MLTTNREGLRPAHPGMKMKARPEGVLKLLFDMRQGLFLNDKRELRVGKLCADEGQHILQDQRAFSGRVLAVKDHPLVSSRGGHWRSGDDFLIEPIRNEGELFCRN